MSTYIKILWTLLETQSKMITIIEKLEFKSYLVLIIWKNSFSLKRYYYMRLKPKFLGTEFSFYLKIDKYTPPGVS